MKKMMMTAPAILLGVFLMGTENGSAQMNSTSQSSSSISSVSVSTPSDQSGIFHVDRFEKRGRKIYAVGWFGSASDTLGRYSLRTPGSTSAMASSTSVGSSSSLSGSYGVTGSSSSSLGSGSFGSSFGSSSGTFGGSSALYGSGSTSGDAATDFQSSSSYDDEQAIMYDLPGDRVDGFGNASPLDDRHEWYIGSGGSSDDLTGTTDAIHQPLIDVQKSGPMVDIQSNGQAVTGIDLNAPRLDMRDTLVSLRNDVNVESGYGYQPLIDAQSDGPLLDLQSNGRVAGIDVNLPRLDVRGDTLIELGSDAGVSSSYDAAYSMGSGSMSGSMGVSSSASYDGSGMVSYYNQDGDLTYINVSSLEEADGMVALPVTFYGASCDQIQLALGPSDGTRTMVNVGNPSTLDENSVGPFIVNLTSASTVRTVSDTQMSDDEASLCMVSRLINGKASRTAIVDNLNKLIGAPIYGPERDGSMR